MNRATHFIGYPTVEQFAQVVQLSEPIYCMLLTEPSETTSHGLRTDRLVIVVSQLDDRGDAHYVRVPVSSLSWVGDTPLDSDQSERRERAKQAYDIVRDWLTAHHFTLREAAIATPASAITAGADVPSDFRLLTGSADFLGYDKDAQRFYLKEGERVAA